MRWRHTATKDTPTVARPMGISPAVHAWLTCASLPSPCSRNHAGPRSQYTSRPRSATRLRRPASRAANKAMTMMKPPVLARYTRRHQAQRSGGTLSITKVRVRRPHSNVATPNQPYSTSSGSRHQISSTNAATTRQPPTVRSGIVCTQKKRRSWRTCSAASAPTSGAGKFSAVSPSTGTACTHSSLVPACSRPGGTTSRCGRSQRTWAAFEDTGMSPSSTPSSQTWPPPYR